MRRYRPGETVWARGEVQAHPEGGPVIVKFRGPGGSTIPLPLDPEGPILPGRAAAASPEPDDLPPGGHAGSFGGPGGQTPPRAP